MAARMVAGGCGAAARRGCGWGERAAVQAGRSSADASELVAGTGGGPLFVCSVGEAAPPRTATTWQARPARRGGACQLAPIDMRCWVPGASPWGRRRGGGSLGLRPPSSPPPPPLPQVGGAMARRPLVPAGRAEASCVASYIGLQRMGGRVQLLSNARGQGRICRFLPLMHHLSCKQCSSLPAPR